MPAGQRLIASAPPAATAVAPRAGAEPRPRETVLGTRFRVHPAFDELLDNKIDDLREQIHREREAGKFIVYISIPLTARGGGHEGTNQAISAFTKRRLEAMYGPSKLWALSPGQVESSIPAVGDLKAAGGEYMYMWTQVLAGADGLGKDFDMVYFVGPRDMAHYFNLGPGARLEALESYVDSRATTDEAFRKEVAACPDKRRDFIRYYGLRASASFSSGALDEWNIFRLVSARREIGDQIPMYFDGFAVSPGEMNSPARLGYQLAPTP
jgi:hypothetical protein